MGYVLHGIRRYLIIKRKSLIIPLENIIILNATHAHTHTSTESTSWSKIYAMKTCLNHTMTDDILSTTFFALRFFQQETLLSLTFSIQHSFMKESILGHFMNCPTVKSSYYECNLPFTKKKTFSYLFSVDFKLFTCRFDSI